MRPSAVQRGEEALPPGGALAGRRHSPWCRRAPPGRTSLSAPAHALRSSSEPRGRADVPGAWHVELAQQTAPVAQGAAIEGVEPAVHRSASAWRPCGRQPSPQSSSSASPSPPQRPVAGSPSLELAGTFGVLLFVAVASPQGVPLSQLTHESLRHRLERRSFSTLVARGIGASRD